MIGLPVYDIDRSVTTVQEVVDRLHDEFVDQKDTPEVQTIINAKMLAYERHLQHIGVPILSSIFKLTPHG